MQKSKVAVYCMTFNHERYLSKTLDSILQQKTDFPFRIIVHEDASTDGTRAIVEDYAARYPEIIVPIYQEKNLYSQGKWIVGDIIMPVIDEPYTAICEGDDFFTDPNKLQMQVDYMDAHPACSMCTHNSMRVDEDGTDLCFNINASNEDKDFTLREIVEAGGGGLFHTTSHMLRTEIWKKMPESYRIRDIEDYQTGIFMALHGDVHYIGKVMAAWRINAAGNWTSRLAKDVDKVCAHYQNVLETLKAIDEDTGYQYHEIFGLGGVNKTQYLIWYYRDEIFKILENPDTRAIFYEKPLHRRFLAFNKHLLKWMLRKVGAF